MANLAWIGTGVMGLSMCGHLLRAGHSITISSRTKERAKALLEAGARWADTPAAAVSEAEFIFSMVGYPHDVREVYLGAHGVVAAARSGAVLVDMTTSTPALAEEIARAASARGLGCLDAPVSGGDVGAKNAALSIMVGGEPAALDRVRPLFEAMGKTIVHQGPAGAGQHTKMVNQVLIATMMIGVCEGLLYGYKAGLNLETMMQSVSGGAAGSWSLSNYGPRMLKNDFNPGFFVEHFIKDMGIALEEAGRMNLSLPGLALAHQLYQALKAQGHGRKGTQSLILALEKLSGIRWHEVA